MLSFNFFTMRLSLCHKAGTGCSHFVARHNVSVQNNTSKPDNGQSDLVSVAHSKIAILMNQNKDPYTSLDGINYISNASSSTIDISGTPIDALAESNP